VRWGPRGEGICCCDPYTPSSPLALLSHPSASLTSWENSCAVGREERLESGALTGRLCCDTEMLLGCTMMLMHCPMLSAKRCGSSARSQLSRGEHLGSTWQCTSSAHGSAHRQHMAVHISTRSCKVSRVLGGGRTEGDALPRTRHGLLG